VSDDLDALLDAFEVKARRFGSVKADLSVRSLESGIRGLDQYGILRSERPDLFVIGARPGNGKTSFLVQILRSIAKADGYTMMFSLEMDAGQLMMRALASETGVATDRLGALQEGRRAAAEAKINQENFYVDDTSGIDINTLRARVMDFKKRHKLVAVGVDYLQIVSAGEKRSKREEVGEVGAGLKQLAKDINCPVIALAQMSREIEKRQQLSKTARPVMSDLQECSLIENWADQIMFLDGAGKRDPSRQGQIDAYIAKNRHGATGDFILTFDGKTTKFSDYEEQGL
jgi:replicative DNA helicase